MMLRYDPLFLKKLKKANVRIRKRFKERITLFIENPLDSQLHNHALQREYQGHRSIDITSDWRAIYTEKKEDDEVVAYFITIGTHRDLYGTS